MNCPYCNSDKSEVIDKRNRKIGYIWRRRKCLECGKNFSTREIVVHERRNNTGTIK